MSSTAFIGIEDSGLTEAIGWLNSLASSALRTSALAQIGGILESGARARMDETKVGPDGVPWAAWSAAHARTRHGGQSLLSAEGDLLDSLAFEVFGDELQVGAGMVYGATHQFGLEDKNIPARPFLGISTDEADTINETLAALIAPGLRGGIA